ncbi:MMPL family protein [compost metagenome]
MTKLRNKLIVACWLLLLAFSGWIAVAHTKIYTDLTGFLPTAPDRTQQLLLDQLREGPASRLILIGIEGDSTDQLANLSRDLAQTLRQDKRLTFVHNGELNALTNERDILLRYRYLLSPAITPEHFEAAALKSALQASAQMLASQAGTFAKTLIPLDPTGEVARIFSLWTPATQIDMHDGVWFSADNKRALLIAQTTASGMDVNAQQDILASVRQRFSSVAKDADSKAQLLLSGTGVFAAESRKLIENDSWRLSVIASTLVLLVLWLTYRSIGLTMLAYVPAVSGLLIGTAAVSLVFGGVHGITLAFAATLIGEAVDYPNYAFLHTARGEPVRNALLRVGSTLRLAILTTAFSSIAMLLSSFSGLAQLGLLSLVSVAVAGLTTYFVLPAIAGATLTSRKLEHLPIKLSPGNRWRVIVLPLVLIAVAALFVQRQQLWDDDLASLSPISADAKKLDQELRNQLGAPDVRYLLIASGKNREQALQQSELLRPDLNKLREDGVISGYDMAANYLPSEALQAQRQAALPDAQSLKGKLQQAMADLPFRNDAFAPFLKDIAAAKHQALLKAEDLDGSSLGLKIRSLLLDDKEGAVALITLSGVHDPARLQAALPALQEKGLRAIDLKDDTGRLISTYRDEALQLSAFGMVLITFLLLFSLRSWQLTLRVLYPVISAVILSIAATVIVLGEKLTLFHLVSMLLVIGIGLNYSIFFNREETSADDTQRNHLSLITCGLTTFLSFGTLTLSSLPVLHAIGQTVTIGAVLSMVCAYLLARPTRTGAV